MAIELETGAHLIKVTGRITGKERDVRLVDEDVNGKAVRTEKQVIERVADVGEWDRADGLLNCLRSQCKRFGITVEPLGFLTDELRASQFREACEAVLVKIREHNRTAKFHRVVGPTVRQPEPEVLCCSIGTALTAATAHRIYDTVETALKELKQAVITGNVGPGPGGIPYWIQRNKTLDALMPSIIAAAVADAVADASRLLKELREAKEAGADLSVVGPTLDVSLIDTALALVAAPVTP